MSQRLQSYTACKSELHYFLYQGHTSWTSPNLVNKEVNTLALVNPSKPSIKMDWTRIVDWERYQSKVSNRDTSKTSGF